MGGDLLFLFGKNALIGILKSDISLFLLANLIFLKMLVDSTFIYSRDLVVLLILNYGYLSERAHSTNTHLVHR